MINKINLLFKIICISYFYRFVNLIIEIPLARGEYLAKQKVEKALKKLKFYEKFNI